MGKLGWFSRRSWLVVLFALLLASCGGGGGDGGAPKLIGVDDVNARSQAPRSPPPGGFQQLVAFGDSLSDDGAYTLAAVLYYATHGKPWFRSWPYTWGGQFSVNGTGAPINWTDQLAAALGLTLTPNLVGFGLLNSESYMLTNGLTTTDPAQAQCAFGRTPGEPVPNCTNFAQGGSRVTNPNGIGHQPDPATGTWALTYPVSRQLQNYLAQFGGFNAQQLVTLLAGNNDIFIAAKTVQDFRDSHPGEPLQPVIQQAQADIGAAADQLADQARQILDHGASYLVVYTLPDSAWTPRGQDWRRGAGCNPHDASQDCFLLSDLSQLFNQRLSADLFGLPVKMVDGYALFNRMVVSPAAFGLSNVVTPWCDPGPTLTQPTSSLLCNVETPNSAYGANADNLDTWLFADEVHPAPGGQRAISQASQNALRGFGWIS